MNASATQPATIFLVVLAITAGRYLLFAGGAWLLAYVLCRRRWAHRKIIAHPPAPGDVRWEVRQSAVTILVFAVIGTATFIAAGHGLTRIYQAVDARGWPWFWTSLGLAIVLHDAYFYWTHRLMHTPTLFRLIHATHHHSRNPSPWAAYSFSPLEAVVEAGIFPLVVVLIPIHPGALSLFMLWQIVFNVVGHTGFEHHARGLMDSRLRYVLNTPTNHVQHHAAAGGNYGLYFNYWDRLMGTNQRDYESRFRQVTTRSRLPSGARVPGVPESLGGVG